MLKNFVRIFKDDDQSWKAFWLEISILICVVLFVRFYVFQFFRVSGPSMCPTLNMIDEQCEQGKGEFIFVDQFSHNFRTPERGEIVVFKPPVPTEKMKIGSLELPFDKNTYYIKRVMGLPGDIIDVRDGELFLTNQQFTNQKMEEPFLSDKNKDQSRSQMERFEVPEGHYVLMGDNRRKSLDSRSCFGDCSGDYTAYVPLDNIKGTSKFVIWPFWLIRWTEDALLELR